jgi:AcrR family transcriptional regulator
MVQKGDSAQEKSEPRRRGRPRAYDPEQALARATDVFWRAGYAGTSLDDLAAAMRMNRPSLYAAFGDKRDLYVATVRRYQAEMRAAMRPHFTAEVPLREALRRIFSTAMAVYGAHGGRGCYTVATAVTQSVLDPEVRQLLIDWARESDAAFTTLVRAAAERGELPPGAVPGALAILAVATLHTLAVRTRGGASPAELQVVVEAALTTLCGAEGDQPSAKRRARRGSTLRR